MTTSLFSFPNDMNIISDQILNTFPKNDKDELAFKDVYVPYTNNIVPLWDSGVEQAQINFDYSPFSAMYYVMKEYPDEFYDITTGHVIYTQGDYDRKRKKFNKLFMKILNGRGNGPQKGMCSEDEMIRFGTLFYTILQASESTQGLVLDEKLRFKADWNGEKQNINLGLDNIYEKSEKLNNFYFSDCEWSKIFYRFIPSTDEDTFWFVKMPDFLSQSYMNKKSDVDSFNWMDQPSFVTFTKFVDSITEKNGKIGIYFSSTPKFTKKLVSMLGLKENMKGQLQNNKTYLFTDVLDYDYQVISNYDVTKPVNYERDYHASRS